MIWTPDDDARLLRMLEDGMSYSQAGAVFKLTRQAISGRVWRLRGKKTTVVKRPPAVTGEAWTPAEDDRLVALIENGATLVRAAEKLGRSRDAVAKRVVKLRGKGRKVVKAPVEKIAVISHRRPIPRVIWPDEPMSEVEPLMVSLIENTGCRFPYGDSDFRFCGHPKHAASSWCAAHFRIVYMPRSQGLGGSSEAAFPTPSASYGDQGRTGRQAWLTENFGRRDGT